MVGGYVGVCRLMKSTQTTIHTSEYSTHPPNPPQTHPTIHPTIHQAVALLDALNGDGGPLWDAYANLILPSPHTLTHPVALPRAMLLELQHSLIIDAALEQKQRLKIMFPGFSVPMEEGLFWRGQGCV